jgi:hypothetical protein
MRLAYLVLPALFAATWAQADASTELQCGRENPTGEGHSEGIGHVPVKVTSKGLWVTYRYPHREYVYRILGVNERTVTLQRVDSQGSDKAENTAEMKFDPELVKKSANSRNTSIDWVDSAPDKLPVSRLTPGRTWLFCTNIDGFLQGVRDELGARMPSASRP